MMGKLKTLDLATLGGLVVATAGILGGLFLEGGTVADIAQITGALIVFGGTVGATLITTPVQVLQRAVRRLPSAFFEEDHRPTAIVEQLVGYAVQARRKGLVSLEDQLEQIEDPFLKKALTLVIDGVDLQQVRQIMELEIQLAEERAEQEAHVYEQAGGYAPTIGILGAVLGLIQVMKHLQNIEEVGKGIAVAFVATVYGVGSANLFFIPIANKLRSRAQFRSVLQRMTLEGVLQIAEGLNPQLLRSRLEAYLKDFMAGDKPATKPSRQAA